MRPVKKQRIWELDALRGAALLGMIVIHFVYDLVELTGLLSWEEPAWYLFIKNNCGGVFLVISGISATLGSHCVRRGIQVLAGGLLCTAVTAGMYFLGLSGGSIIIWFGVLHCLGVCMLLWAVLGKLPDWSLLGLGVGLTALGLILQGRCFHVHWSLIPLGLTPDWFVSSDYFPMLPHLGFFLLGAVLGRRLYREKRTRFPRVDPAREPVRFLCRMGRNSLAIYLLHQPVLMAVVFLLQWLL